MNYQDVSRCEKSYLYTVKDMISFTCEDIDFDTFADEFAMFQCQSLSILSRNIFGSSSAIFGNLLNFSEKFGKCLETFVRPSDNILKSSEIFKKGSEIFGKSSKTSLFVREISI